MSECAASDRMASDPVSTPTTALAPVSPADAAIDPSATRCLTSCIGAAPCRARLAGRDERVNATAAPAPIFYHWLAGLRLRQIAKSMRSRGDSCGDIFHQQVAARDAHRDDRDPIRMAAKIAGGQAELISPVDAVSFE